MAAKSQVQYRCANRKTGKQIENLDDNNQKEGGVFLLVLKKKDKLPFSHVQVKIRHMEN